MGLLLLGIGSLQAQGEYSPILLPRSVQSNLLNPAMNDGSKFALALPAAGITLSHEGFRPGDLIRPVPGQPDSLMVDVNNAVLSLGDRGVLGGEVHADVFQLAIGGKKFRLLGGASVRTVTSIEYPVDAIRLAWYGNAPYLDKPLDLGPGFSTTNWWEAYLCAQVGIGNKIRVGGKIKYLGGILYAGATSSQAIFTTAADGYTITGDLNYRLLVSGPDLSGVNWADYSSLQNIPLPSQRSALFAGNHGMGADLGVVVNPIEKLDIGLSVLDLGVIYWRNGFGLNASGSATFEGINVSPFFQGDSVDIQHLADSFFNRFSVKQVREEFQTRLPMRFVLHAGFEPVKWVRVQGMLQARRVQGSTDVSWALGGQLRAGRVLDLGLSYGRRTGVGNLIGIQTSLKLGPVMIYAMSDHALSALQWENARLAHVRLGVNLQIGRQDRKKGNPSLEPEIPLK